MPRTNRSIGWSLALVVIAATILTGCGAQATAGAPKDSDSMTAASGAADTAEGIVGRWMQVHTCDQLVQGLEDQGLGAIAPAVVGDFFPDTAPSELAAKDDLCAGAKPQRHFHFFDAVGLFGSIDQHDQQVDDGSYVVQGDLLEIGEGAWRYTVHGDELSLEPQITRRQRREALADPLEWSTAGWIVAVAYPGTTWRRVPCDGWC